LLGRFVNFPALLEYLSEENVTGSVVVAGDPETGVILLQEGKVAGAYTESSRQVTTKTDAVAALAASPGARIEVKTSAGDVFPIDVDGALAKPY
jgi:formylmethanofuran dehydrogenase subunit D